MDAALFSVHFYISKSLILVSYLSFFKQKTLYFSQFCSPKLIQWQRSPQVPWVWHLKDPQLPSQEAEQYNNNGETPGKH